jgi:hypothetical protein
MWKMNFDREKSQAVEPDKIETKVGPSFSERIVEIV